MPENDSLRPIDILKTTSKVAASAVLLQLAGTAFSRGRRREIVGRARYKSEVSHRSDRPLEASHIDHTKESKLYDDPRNGILMTDQEHLIYHEDFMGNAWAIGLTEGQNDWSVGALSRRVEEFNLENGIPELDPRRRDILSDAIKYKVNEVCRRVQVESPYDRIIKE